MKMFNYQRIPILYMIVSFFLGTCITCSIFLAERCLQKSHRNHEASIILTKIAVTDYYNQWRKKLKDSKVLPEDVEMLSKNSKGAKLKISYNYYTNEGTMLTELFINEDGRIVEKQEISLVALW